MICKICNNEVKNYIALGLHLRKYHNMTSKKYYDLYLRQPNEGICPECSKETNFQGIRLGYLKFCCPTCAQLNKDTRQKYKNTCLEKYGAENVFASEYGKNKIKESNLNHHGVEYPQQSEEIRNKSALIKLQRYGDKTYNNSKKNKQTCKEKYGVESFSQTDTFKNLMKKSYKDKRDSAEEKYKEQSTSLQKLIRLYGNGWHQAKIVSLIELDGLQFIRNSDIDIIKKYVTSTHMFGVSFQEQKLYDLILKYYSGTIIRNIRQIISPKELDFYLPDLNLAIEYNGLYYHSIEYGIPSDYHYNKSIQCFNKGIRLIHFYEFESFDVIEQFLINLFTNQEIITNDFNKFMPLDNNINFSGPQLIYKDNSFTLYGSGIFTN